MGNGGTEINLIFVRGGVPSEVVDDRRQRIVESRLLDTGEIIRRHRTIRRL